MDILFYDADMILSYFVELEEKYGAILVSHLLAYITASKHGLTEPEILDILALDTEVYQSLAYFSSRNLETFTCAVCCCHQVMSEVRRKFANEDSSGLIFLPPVIWSQLGSSLQSLLTYRVGVDHSLVLCWCHHRLREVAQERYLPQDSSQVCNSKQL